LIARLHVEKEDKMSSYYHFHKQQANEQIQARLQEAESHRLSKQGNDHSPLSILLKLTLPLLVGVAVAILLLTSCTTGDARADDSANRAVAPSKVTMAERIHFQDAQETTSEADRVDPNVEAMTMAERISFQDRRDGHLIGEQVAEQSSDWTMAERIQFHDRIWGQ
jgi:hypothetical protein